MCPWQGHSTYKNLVASSIKWMFWPRSQWCQFRLVGKCSVGKESEAPSDLCGPEFCDRLGMSAIDVESGSIVVYVLYLLFSDGPSIFCLSVFYGFYCELEKISSLLAFCFNVEKCSYSWKQSRRGLNPSKQYCAHLLQRDQLKQSVHGRDMDLDFSHL